MIVNSLDKFVLSLDSAKKFLYLLSCGLEDIEDGNIHNIETLWDKLDEEIKTVEGV